MTNTIDCVIKYGLKENESNGKPETRGGGMARSKHSAQTRTMIASPFINDLIRHFSAPGHPLLRDSLGACRGERVAEDSLRAARGRHEAATPPSTIPHGGAAAPRVLRGVADLV